MTAVSSRWLAMAVFALYSALNYLDRQTLAALGPQIISEFHISNEDYGRLHAAFYGVYAICSPFAGLLIDRIGLSRGAMLTVGLWSLAAASTGISKGFGGLLACRVLLGVAESGGIPAFSKASATYLLPNQRALGSGLNQLGISSGIMAAPLLTGLVAEGYGWRTAFALFGLLSLLWIPLWRFVEGRTRGVAVAVESGPTMTPRAMLRDPRLYALVFGNILVMSAYQLWINWTTIFLVNQYHLQQGEVNRRYAWIPGIFAAVGGLFGGWLAMKFMGGGATVMQARSRSILMGSIALLATAAVPFMPDAGWATAMVSFSFFWSVAVSANVYALPQDLFGAQRTGFAVAAITLGYGLLVAFTSPLVGRSVDHSVFVLVCELAAVLPLAGVAVVEDHDLSMKERIKAIVFRLLGKEPEAVVVTFATGTAEKVRAMTEEVHRLIPDRRHVLIEHGSLWTLWKQLWRYRIGMAAVLFDGDPSFASLRMTAFLLAPSKILAYNDRLERHHLQMRTWLASWLFWRGAPLDRIWLRPRWLWWTTRDRSVTPDDPVVIKGRLPRPGRQRIGVLTPFTPYPLSHGGAVRLYNLLREMAVEYDVYLFAFREKEQDEYPWQQPLLEICTSIATVSKPRYREPRWSTLLPPEVREYESAPMRRLIAQVTREQHLEVLQVEYTQLARYGGEVLVEHDVTYDLYAQLHSRKGTLSSWWDWWRWRRFERKAVRRYSRVVTMSAKDSALLGISHAQAVPNGVDLARFRPAPEPQGQRVLFIGSFRHFPNVAGYQFFLREVWPLVRDASPGMTVTVVAGPDPLQYVEMPADPRIRLVGFVSDVRPLYEEANIVLVPTLVSAGTNVKVLEAMAMERAIVSTTSGCGGIPAEHGKHVWIADGAQPFAEGIVRLASDSSLRRALARNSRALVEERFDWATLGQLQRDLIREVLPERVSMRRGAVADLNAVRQIQALALPSSRWDAEHYLSHEFYVALYNGSLAGFIVARKTAPDEREILNIAVAPEYRCLGMGEALLRKLLNSGESGDVFLEVRESNVNARKLYAKVGFEDVGRRVGYYEDPPETAVIMRIVVTGSQASVQSSAGSQRQV